LTHSEVVEMMKGSIQGVKDVLTASLKYISADDSEDNCDCRKILDEPGVKK